MQGIIQSAFLWGYIGTTGLGGSLADKYGGEPHTCKSMLEDRQNDIWLPPGIVSDASMNNHAVLDIAMIVHLLVPCKPSLQCDAMHFSCAKKVHKNFLACPGMLPWCPDNSACITIFSCCSYQLSSCSKFMNHIRGWIISYNCADHACNGLSCFFGHAA